MSNIIRNTILLSLMVVSAFVHAGAADEAGTSHQNIARKYTFTLEQFRWLDQKIEEVKKARTYGYWPGVISEFNQKFGTDYLNDATYSVRFARAYNNKHRGLGVRTYTFEEETLVEEIVWDFILKDIDDYERDEDGIYTHQHKPQIDWISIVSTYMPGHNPRTVRSTFARRNIAKARIVQRLRKLFAEVSSRPSTIRGSSRLLNWIEVLAPKIMQQPNDNAIQNAQEMRGVKRAFEQIDENESQAGVTPEGRLVNAIPVCGSASPRSYETYELNQYENEDEYREFIMRGTQEGPGVRLSQMPRNSLNCSEPPVYYIPSELMSPRPE